MCVCVCVYPVPETNCFMLQKSSDHQLRLVVEIPFTVVLDIPCGDRQVSEPSRVAPKKPVVGGRLVYQCIPF